MIEFEVQPEVADYHQLFSLRNKSIDYEMPSGRTLSIDREPCSITIEDVESPGFYMGAFYSPDHHIFYVNLQTRSEYVFNFLRNGRHPDMHAKKFIFASFDYFKKQHFPIRVCQGLWLPTSDNLKQYREARCQLPPSEAALSTWTGQVFSLMGYSKVEEINEKLGLDGKTIMRAEVGFVKP